MKKSLGRVFLLLSLFLQLQLFATTYEWSAAINKQKAYVNEPVHLRYICTFSDRAQLYSIEFNPSGEYEKFSVKILRESENIVDGKKISSYEFVLFPKKAGEIEIAFEAVMKLTTKESIEEMVIGRDNVKKEDVKKTIFRQKLFKVAVEETNSSLSGNFTIDVKKRKPSVKAYEPYHLDIKIYGEGNFEAIEPIGFEIEGVKIFAGEIMQTQKLSQEGESGEWNQKFAFVAEKDFVIPRREIEYFDLKAKKIDKLVIEAINVKVESGFNKEELLDEAEEDRFAFDISYLYYLLIFITGFFAGKIKIKKSSEIKNRQELFRQKVEEAKSLDELMILLVLEDAKRYEPLIREIEEKKITSLGRAKKMSHKSQILKLI